MKPIILSNSFVVTLLFVCLSVKYASPLRCYECDSYRSPIDDATACTKSDPSMIRECPESDKPVCRTLKAENSVSGIPYIKRSCGTLMFENIEEFVDPKNEIMQFKKGVPVSSMVCNTNLCNGNGAAAVGNPYKKNSLFIGAMLSLYLYKYVY